MQPLRAGARGLTSDPSSPQVPCGSRSDAERDRKGDPAACLNSGGMEEGDSPGRLKERAGSLMLWYQSGRPTGLLCSETSESLGGHLWGDHLLSSLTSRVSCPAVSTRARWL